MPKILAINDSSVFAIRTEEGRSFLGWVKVNGRQNEIPYELLTWEVPEGLYDSPEQLMTILRSPRMEQAVRSIVYHGNSSHGIPEMTLEPRGYRINEGRYYPKLHSQGVAYVSFVPSAIIVLDDQGWDIFPIEYSNAHLSERLLMEMIRKNEEAWQRVRRIDIHWLRENVQILDPIVPEYDVTADFEQRTGLKLIKNNIQIVRRNCRYFLKLNGEEYESTNFEELNDLNEFTFARWFLFASRLNPQTRKYEYLNWQLIKDLTGGDLGWQNERIRSLLFNPHGWKEYQPVEE